MMDSRGACAAATSWETSELTLITEPPAASALLLPATETTDPMVPLLPVVPLVALVLMDLPASLPPETRQGGRLAAPALLRQRCADRRRALTAASAAASIRSAESYWPARS